MSEKFNCMITSGTCNGTATEFTFQFVDSAEESRFICLIGTALGTRQVACTVIVGDAQPRITHILDRWSEGPLVYCTSEDVERLESDYAELKASHTVLLAAAKDVSELLKSFVVRTAHFDRIAERRREAIAKAEGGSV